MSKWTKRVDGLNFICFYPEEFPPSLPFYPHNTLVIPDFIDYSEIKVCGIGVRVYLANFGGYDRATNVKFRVSLVERRDKILKIKMRFLHLDELLIDLVVAWQLKQHRFLLKMVWKW